MEETPASTASQQHQALPHRLCATGAVVVSFVLALVLLRILNFGDGPLAETIQHLILAVFVLGSLLLIGGTGSLHFKLRDMGFALRKSAYLLAIALISGLSILIGFMETQTPLTEQVIPQAINVVLLCVLIGIFEEGLFRGILLNGLLMHMGRTKAGIGGAVVLSSLIFGFIHILPAIMTGTITTAITAAQAVMKTLQAGVMGALFAVIYLRTHNIWAASLVHCLNDLLVMLPSSLFASPIAGDYVIADPTEGAALLMGYLFFAVLYIPILVTIVRQFKLIQTPQMGPFWIRHFDKEATQNPPLMT